MQSRFDRISQFAYQFAFTCKEGQDCIYLAEVLLRFGPIGTKLNLTEFRKIFENQVTYYIFATGIFFLLSISLSPLCQSLCVLTVLYVLLGILNSFIHR